MHLMTSIFITEAHFSRIHAIMAEKKKRAAENQPFQIARVMGLVANVLLLVHHHYKLNVQASLKR